MLGHLRRRPTQRSSTTSICPTDRETPSSYRMKFQAAVLFLISSTSLLAGGKFVGSQSCATCHRQVYESWQATRHSYSLLTADEAKQAKFPLPRRRIAGGKPAIQAWKDVSYVLGGRQRITYIDRTGRVSDNSYHHRIGKWDFFPQKQLSDCGPCHFTGFGAGPLHPEDPAVSGRWAERSIGCEACHGPGERHLESYRKEDIVVDVSARSCGTCHTAVGRVLPKDDLHATHDLVQVWNQDRHATSVRSHSFSAFCSSCHSPYEGQVLDAKRGSRRRVYAEQKNNVSCIACHNPHDSTHERYDRRQVSLAPSIPPKSHVYGGNDQDFTTVDYKQLRTTEQVCVQCHRGADRIDLNHAHASCNDCHTGFRRNRSLESRAFHDANQAQLSCRPCHKDADHLMMILFRDPDFLEPSYIHNLRTLPTAVYEKYNFAYASLKVAQSGDSAEVNLNTPLPPKPEPEVQRANKERRPEQESLPPDLRRLLAKRRHRLLAAEEVIDPPLAALKAKPASIFRHLDLANAYTKLEEFEAAREVIEHAMGMDTPWILLDLPLDQDPRLGVGGAGEGPFGATPAEQVLPERLAGAEAPRLWLESFQQMSEAHFDDAVKTLTRIPTLRSGVALQTYLGIAELGRRQYQEALRIFEAVLQSEPDHLTSRLAVAVLHLKLGQFGEARTQLKGAVSLHPTNPVANYLLGRSYLRKPEPGKAAEVLGTAVAASPSFLEAWFSLARAYRLGGDLSSAGEAYREVIRGEPDQFHAHFELAGLFKEISDKAAFKLQDDLESAAPFGTSAREWDRQLVQLEEEVGAYGQSALSSFGTALRIRPFDFESIFQVSEILRRDGQSAESLELLDWLSRRQGERWIYYYRRGTILIELGEYKPAIRELKRALELQPNPGRRVLCSGPCLHPNGSSLGSHRYLSEGDVVPALQPRHLRESWSCPWKQRRLPDGEAGARAFPRVGHLSAASGPPLIHQPGTVEPKARSD